MVPVNRCSLTDQARGCRGDHETVDTFVQECATAIERLTVAESP
jgi:hypothetical protein